MWVKAQTLAHRYIYNTHTQKIPFWFFFLTQNPLLSSNLFLGSKATDTIQKEKYTYYISKI